MPKHEPFEEMCALAALGELPQEGREELREHLRECTSCRASLEQFSSVLNELPVVANDSSLPRPKLLRRDDGYRERFLERARGEGISLSTQVDDAARERRLSWRLPHPAMSWPALTAGALALALLSIAFQVYSAVQRDARRDNHQTTANAIASPAQAPSAQANGSSNQSTIERLQAELVRAGAQVSELRQRLDTLEHAELVASTERADLNSKLQQAREMNAELSKELSARELKMASLQGEITSLQGERAQVGASLSQQQSQVKYLSDQLQSSRDALTRREQLLAQGRDVRELMGARNLHIIDLYDADGRGRTQKTFGRVFYTEGKSLIFYAFDLDEAKLAKAGFTYQAWGEREGQQGSVKRLGMLYVDDHAQKRWVLKVEDPDRLAEIDSVFVTLERSGEPKTPRGQKLLYAYLRSGANHP
jgi:hypothetical protein